MLLPGDYESHPSGAPASSMPSLQPPGAPPRVASTTVRVSDGHNLIQSAHCCCVTHAVIELYTRAQLRQHGMDAFHVLSF